MQLSEICDKTRGKTSYQEIADAADLSARTVGNFLTGATGAPSVYTAGKICRVLHVSMDAYFEVEPEEAEPPPPDETQHKLEIATLAQHYADERCAALLRELEQKDRYIAFLGALAAIMAMRSAVLDITSVSVGFFRGEWTPAVILAMIALAGIAAGTIWAIVYNLRRTRRRRK